MDNVENYDSYNNISSLLKSYPTFSYGCEVVNVMRRHPLPPGERFLLLSPLRS
jgi:hypothetical protein